MTEDLSKIIDYYVEKKKDGLDFSEIRKELQARNLDSDKIKFIMNEIDKQVLLAAQGKSIKISLNETKIIGLILMFGGGFITITTFFGFIDLGGSYLVAYGPVIGGYLLYLQSGRSTKWRQKKR